MKRHALAKNQENLTLLKPMRYENTYAVAVKRSFAKAHQLKRLVIYRKLAIS